MRTCISVSIVISNVTVINYFSITLRNLFFPSSGSCVEECSSDRPCDNNLLCCSNGCGRSCMSGMTVAPLCPALRGQSGGGIGAFIPQCEDDGSFSSIQCWGSTGYCWCVESTSGRPVTEGIRGEPECPGKIATCNFASPGSFPTFNIPRSIPNFQCYALKCSECNIEKLGMILGRPKVSQ